MCSKTIRVVVWVCISVRKDWTNYSATSGKFYLILKILVSILAWPPRCLYLWYWTSIFLAILISFYILTFFRVWQLLQCRCGILDKPRNCCTRHTHVKNQQTCGLLTSYRHSTSKIECCHTVCMWLGFLCGYCGILVILIILIMVRVILTYRYVVMAYRNGVISFRSSWDRIDKFVKIWWFLYTN